MRKRDNIYKDLQDEPTPFEFSARVVDVFPDMIKRSVPGYGTTIALTRLVARRFVTPQTRCYDLGCSLGMSTMAIMSAVHMNDNKVIAVDNSEAMLERCQQILSREFPRAEVDLRLEDLEQTDIQNASMVVMNYTLQFVEPARRQAVIEGIYQGLNPGGVLLLSEKVHLDDDDDNNFLVDIHHDFKRANGYSELEIAGKRNALENVLISDSVGTHRERLASAGFSDCHILQQCFNFTTLLAIK